jgi:hypothetical protein
MTRQKGQKFSQKHGNQIAVDPSIKEKIVAHAKGSELPCAVAFKLAEELSQPPKNLANHPQKLEKQRICLSLNW